LKKKKHYIFAGKMFVHNLARTLAKVLRIFLISWEDGDVFFLHIIQPKFQQKYDFFLTQK